MIAIIIISGVLCLLLTLTGKVSTGFGLVLAIISIGTFMLYYFSLSNTDVRLDYLPIEILEDTAVTPEPPIVKEEPKPTPLPTFSVNLTLENSILEKLEQHLKMNFSSKGKHQLEINHTGDLIPNRYDPARVKYSGGNLEIVVNGRKCCCQPAIELEGTYLPSLIKSRAEHDLIEKVESLFAENLDVILPQIQKCL